MSLYASGGAELRMTLGTYQMLRASSLEDECHWLLEGFDKRWMFQGYWYCRLLAEFLAKQEVMGTNPALMSKILVGYCLFQCLISIDQSVSVLNSNWSICSSAWFQLVSLFHCLISIGHFVSVLDFHWSVCSTAWFQLVYVFHCLVSIGQSQCLISIGLSVSVLDFHWSLCFSAWFALVCLFHCLISVGLYVPLLGFHWSISVLDFHWSVFFSASFALVSLFQCLISVGLSVPLLDFSWSICSTAWFPLVNLSAWFPLVSLFQCLISIGQSVSVHDFHWSVSQSTAIQILLLKLRQFEYLVLIGLSMAVWINQDSHWSTYSFSNRFLLYLFECMFLRNFSLSSAIFQWQDLFGF
jgi:hypothetical protein